MCPACSLRETPKRASRGFLVRPRLRGTSPPSQSCGEPGYAEQVPRGGFTLLELLIVAAIVGLIVGAIGACLGAGIRVWEASRRHSEKESHAVIALEILQKDLMNIFSFHGIDFRGEPTHLSFSGLVAEGAGSDGRPEGGTERIGTVAYTFDRAEKTLVRTTCPFPHEQAEAKAGESALSDIGSLTFLYFVRPDGKDGGGVSPSVGQWVGEWASTTNLPDAVRVDMTLNSEGAPVELSRTVLRLRRD